MVKILSIFYYLNMKNKTYNEDFLLTYNNYSELSYFDNNKKHIIIYVNDNPKGKLEVYTDKENDNREYVIINCEVIYLDSIRSKQTE